MLVGGVLQSSADLVRVLRVLPRVEWDRHVLGPERAVARARARGNSASVGGPDERARLQRVISLVDRFLPGEPSCYRRALLEMSVDAGAAKEPLHVAFRVPGGPRSGHAWLGTAPGPVGSYDVQLEM